MKVGTDGVLLGAWVNLPTVAAPRLLDIGTGTGVIALMLAQRCPEARVVGVDPADLTDARANVAASPWAERVEVVETRVQEYESDASFDLILSNPPFFEESLLPPDAARMRARHTVDLPFAELRDAVVRLLAPSGHFALVLPVTEAERWLRLVEGCLTLTRLTDVRTTPRHPAKRRLMEFRLTTADTPSGHAHAATDTVPLATCLTIGMGAHEEYTDAYKALTRDFYLKF